VEPSDDPGREDPELNSLLPDSSSAPYDMRDVIERVFDDGEFFELHENFAPNLLTGFARLDGWSVGIVANQPAHLGGVLDIDSSEKMARFVSTCDTFNVPLVFLTDAPGVLPGLDQEWNGIIRRGAKPIYTAAEATVPRIDLVTRKAYGGSYAIMGAKHFLTDINFAWPSAEIAVMGAEGAAGVLFRREIAEADDPEQRREELIEEYKAQFLNPYSAAEWGYIDDVIEPRQTRPKLIRAMRVLRSKRVVNQQKRKHGNMPL
jgi:propionyl-CoA carboxylase beta chain